jgi:hypothetical protein
VEEWRERFMLAAENGLRARPKEDEVLARKRLIDSSAKSAS